MIARVRTLWLAGALGLAGLSAAGTNAVSISTSLPMAGRHEATAVADGRPETWFESARPTRDGDDFLIQFPEPFRPDRIRVLSGDREENKRIEFATLEVSVDGDDIHVSSEWVTRKAPHDYGMVVHELTHVVQNYQGGGEGWLTEGIADYTRFWHFEPGAWKPEIDPERDSYRGAYRVTAAFLAWLVEKHDPEIVRKLNTASRHRQPASPVFLEATGKAIDVLWREYADGFRRPPQP